MDRVVTTITMITTAAVTPQLKGDFVCIITTFHGLRINKKCGTSN
ncbi:MAG: hypothetical protein WAQ29_10535 [Nitrososphaeraceae archaeon]